VSQCFQPHLPEHQSDGLGAAEQGEDGCEREGRELVKGVAIGENQAAYRIGVGVDDELTQAAAGVIAHQCDIGKVERDDEVADECRYPVRRQLGARVYRDGVGAQRPRRQDAAKPLSCQPFCHVSPQAMVDEDAMDEQHRRMRRILGSEDLVIDRCLFERDLRHLRYPP